MAAILYGPQYVKMVYQQSFNRNTTANNSNNPKFIWVQSTSAMANHNKRKQRALFGGKSVLSQVVYPYFVVAIHSPPAFILLGKRGSNVLNNFTG